MLRCDALAHACRKLLPVKQPSTYAFNQIISEFELKI
jgi:hypothetical protein